MPDNVNTIVCRTCDVAAECTFPDSEAVDWDDIVSVKCATCEVIVEGSECRKMVKEILQFLALSTASDIFGKGFRRSRNVRYTPTRIQEPKWPFTLRP